MKKTYPLATAGKNADRVLDAVKNDIRKYIKRCRATKLPEGVDFWDFECKVGVDAASAAAVHVAQVTQPVDVVALAGHASVYVQIEAKDGHRVYTQRAPSEPQDSAPEATPASE